MAKTNSWNFPHLINPTQNCVAIIEDEASIVNRSKLLILTEPTELYNSPNQGVGLKRHLWQYNTDNEKAIIKDRIVEQLRLHEPQCNPDGTQFVDDTIFTGTHDDDIQHFQEINMTVSIQTLFSNEIAFDLDSI